MEGRGACNCYAQSNLVSEYTWGPSKLLLTISSTCYPYRLALWVISWGIISLYFLTRYYSLTVFLLTKFYCTIHFEPPKRTTSLQSTNHDQLNLCHSQSVLYSEILLCTKSLTMPHFYRQIHDYYIHCVTILGRLVNMLTFFENSCSMLNIYHCTRLFHLS